MITILTNPILSPPEDVTWTVTGSLTVTLPDGIGRKREVHHMSADRVEQAVAYLQTRRGGGG